MKPITTLAGLAAAAAVVTGGVLLATSDDDTNVAPSAQRAIGTPTQLEPAATTDSGTANPTPRSPADGQAITAEQASVIAVDHIGGGTAVDIERESEHGRTVWDVEVVHDRQEIEVHVDAVTGEVTRIDRDDRDDRHDDDRYDDDHHDRHSDDDDRYDDD